MRNTGLVDINGIPIHEEDIIKDVHTGRIATVGFVNGYFILDFSGIPEQENIGVYDIGIFSYVLWEVINNIYKEE